MPVVIPTLDPTRGGTTTNPKGNGGSHNSGGGGNHGGGGRSRGGHSVTPVTETESVITEEETKETTE